MKPLCKLIFAAALFALTLNSMCWAQCTNPNAIYVVPNGTGNGSAASPTNLPNAISIHNNNPARDKIIMSGGAYTFFNTVNIPSNINIEGGFRVSGSNWYKDPLYSTTLSIIPPFQIAVVRNVPRGINAGNTRIEDSVLVAHIIGLKLDSVQNITLQDFNLNVYNSGGVSWLPTRDGYSVYAIYSYKSKNIVINHLDIATSDAQGGGFGLDGRDGYDSYYYVPGGQEIDNTRTTNIDQPIFRQLPESNDKAAGAAGGYGGPVQGMMPCAAVNCLTNGCMPQSPPPTGASGHAGYFGNGGGTGGVCGDACALDCYFETYSAFIPNEENIVLGVADAIYNQAPPSYTVNQDPTGRGGTNGQDGPDGLGYTNSGLAYQGDIFYVPGTGEPGNPGGGGAGGGGGGAGGIRSLSIPSGPFETPDVVDMPLAVVGLSLQAVNLAATVGGVGNDVCSAEIINCSTPGGLGGGGGEGGEAGGGGGGGGSVFGIYSYLSVNLGVGSVTYHLGEPGLGGEGGEGGEGGQGGFGIEGRPLNSVTASISNRGAKGGNGGRGGKGGTGQNGGDGVKYETYGFGNAQLVYSADTAHACTNSVIGIVKNPQTTMTITMNGAASNVQTITNTPSYIEVAISQPGTIHIIQSNTQYWNTYAFHDIVVSTQRSLPGFHVPAQVCVSDTLLLAPDDTTFSSYYWRIYRNGNLVTSSREREFRFFPPLQSGNTLYRVYLQTYETCCGWSTPTEHYFVVESPAQLTITPYLNLPFPSFCAGEDSSKLVLTGVPLSSNNTYPGVTWSTGATDVNQIWVKDNGAYSVTYTAPSGCVTHSVPYTVNSVFPLPTTTPQIFPTVGTCFQGEVTLYPSDGQAWAFSFYPSPNSPYPFPLGKFVHEFTFMPNFGVWPNLQDSTIVYVAPVSDQGCTGLNRAAAVIYHEKNPPAAVQPFASYYSEIADAGCGKSVSYQVPAGMDGFCNDYVNVTRISGPPSGAIFPVGTTSVVHRLTDYFGNYTDVTSYVEVRDVTPPVVNGVLSNINLNAVAGTCSAVFHLPSPTATDNCQTNLPVNFYWSGLFSNDSVFGVGTTQLYYNATDPSGNTTAGNYSVTVFDNQPPVFNCPGNITFYIQGTDTAAWTYYSQPTVTDNCSLVGNAATLVSGFGAYGLHPLGTTVETFSCTDRAGNVATCSFNLTVADSISPVVLCPDPVYITTAPGLSYGTVIYTTPTASDNLAGTVSVTKLSGKASGDTASIGVYTAIWTGTDNWGNVGSCPVQITVSDMEGPNLICPNNISVMNDTNLCGAMVGYSVQPALDNDLNYYIPNMMAGIDSGSFFPIGTTNVVYRVADAQNNRSYCSFNVTVIDTVPPVFTSGCPNDTTVNINPTICGQYVAQPLLAASDNSCANPTIGLVTGSVSGYYEMGTTVQQYQIRDNQNNTTVCTYHVTVVDNNNLTITCPPDITRNTDPGLCTAYIPYYGSPVVTPNYGSCINIGTLNNPGPNFPAGTVQVTYTASVNSHYAQCFFSVTVIDNEVPNITTPANILADVTPGTCGSMVNFNEPVGTDNCTNGLGTFRLSGLAPGSEFPIGSTVQSYVVTDLVGHLDTAIFTVTVRDTVPPVIAPHNNITGSTNNMCGLAVNFTEPVGTDNSACVTTTRIAGYASGDLFPLGSTTQIYVARDSAGNVDTCTFTVTITPQYPLQTNCMDHWLQPDPAGFGQIVYYPVPGTTDQITGIPNPCPGVTVMLMSGQGSGAFFTPGPHFEHYRFLVNGTGDTLDCTTNIIVTEFNPPVIDCGSTQQYEITPDSGSCSATMLLPVPTVTDGLNTGPILLTHEVDYITDTNTSYTFGPGLHTVTFHAYDYSSNQSSCTYYVKVVDNVRIGNPFVSPIIVCQNQVVDIDPQLQGFADSLTYQWVTTDSLGNYYTCSTEKILHFNRVNPSDQKQYSFRVLDRCGSIQIGNEFLLQVTPAPATAIAGLNSNYCIYDSTDVLLQCSPSGGVLVGHGINGLAFNPQIAGIGTHTIEYSWYDTSSGCTGISSQVVVVNDTPVVSIFADTLYCVNAGQIQLPTTNSTYTGAGISGFVFNPQLAGGGYHTITRTMNVNGCIGKRKQNVFVNTVIPNASISAPGTICEASGSYLLSVVTPGGTWTGDFLTVDTISGNASLNSRSTGSGTDTVYYDITVNGCYNHDTAYIQILDKSDSLPYTLPQFCSNGTQLQFDTSRQQQYLGLGFTLSGQFTPANVGHNGLIFYSVITTNQFGCTDTTFRLLYMRGGQLNVSPAQYVCNPGDSLLINLQSEYDSIRWWNGSSANPMLFTDTGQYTVFLRDTMGCSGYDTLHVLQYPSRTPIVSSTSVYACPSSTGLVSTTNDSSFLKFMWSTGDTTASISALPGTYTVTVTNWWGCQQVSAPVTVTTGADLVPPSITCPPDTAVNTLPGACTVTGVALGNATAIDNCGVLSINNNAPANYVVGVNSVTWTVTDFSNNTNTCVQHIVVADSSAPYFTQTPTSSFIADTNTLDNCSSRLPDFTTLFSATDSCSAALITQLPAAGTLVHSAQTPVTISATDVSGNTVTYYMVYQTADTVLPVLICPGDITDTTFISSAVINYNAPQFASNCSNSTVTRIAGLGSGATFPIGVTTETYVVEDGAGAKDTCSFTVTVTQISGISKTTEGGSMVIMPVPTKDHLTVIYQNNAAQSFTLKLMNSTGQLLISEEKKQFDGKYNKTFDLSNQAAGTYMIEIITDIETISRKVIKL